MAGKWEGFSEDEIKFYINKIDKREDNGSPPTGREIVAVGKQRKTRKDKHSLHSDVYNAAVPTGLTEAAYLLKRKETLPSDVITHVEGQYLSNGQTPLESDTPGQDSKPLQSIDKNNESPAHDSQPLSEESLEQFHARQKLLEEQNRQRKQYLSKLLSDRKKQTTQEAQRLQKIQEELHKLDVLLSDDVSILRDEIEGAAREFGEAQKRFNKAEKEFLDAKQCLFAKMDRKELLTKHLCTIIEQNELRKANKLSELMNKLVASTEDAKVEVSSAPSMQLSTPSLSENNSSVECAETAKIQDVKTKQDTDPVKEEKMNEAAATQL